MSKEMEGREGGSLLAQDPGFRLGQRTEEGSAGRQAGGRAGWQATWHGLVWLSQAQGHLAGWAWRDTVAERGAECLQMGVQASSAAAGSLGTAVSDTSILTIPS